MANKKMNLQFIILTFCIAYFISGVLIFLGQFGYSVHSWVQSLAQMGMNIPFAGYILSPAIASYIVLKRNKKVASFTEWAKTVFYVKNNPLLYLFVFAGLGFYFLIHLAVTGPIKTALPLYTFFLSLPGNLVIGGLEEAGWSFVLQPGLDKKYGYILSSLLSGFIWLLWHVPLFFIPGTNHSGGMIDFWMFAVQIIAFRFFYGTLIKLSGKGSVFLCVLFHTMFNAAAYTLGIPPATWAGTVAANAGIILVSFITLIIYTKIQKQASA